MLSGKLSCPKCQSTGMNGYEYYESKTFDDGEARWIFYNTIIKFKQWKCWALVEECGCRVHKCYDPFGCCFNPCDHTPDVVTYMLPFIFGMIFIITSVRLPKA